MAERHDGFDRTLETLGQEREARELQYRAQLQRLRDLLESLAAAARHAEALAVSREQRLAELAAGAGVTGALPLVDGLPLPDQDPWPSSGRWFRRAVNSAIAWLLRDYLAVLDRRHQAVGLCVSAHTEVLQSLHSTLGESLVQLQRCDATVPALEALREALNRTVECLDAFAEFPDQLRLLDDAKHAETLQRATHGPLRKMDLVFGEFGRQQEALLAELVGRRQELDALVSTLRGDADREPGQESASS